MDPCTINDVERNSHVHFICSHNFKRGVDSLKFHPEGFDSADPIIRVPWERQVQIVLHYYSRIILKSFYNITTPMRIIFMSHRRINAVYSGGGLIAAAFLIERNLSSYGENFTISQAPL